MAVFQYPGNSTDGLSVIGQWLIENAEPSQFDTVTDSEGNTIAQWVNGCLIDPRELLCKRVQLCDVHDVVCQDGMIGCDDCPISEGESVVLCFPSMYFETGTIEFCEVLACNSIDEKNPATEPRELSSDLTYENGDAQASMTPPAGIWKFEVKRSIGQKTKIGPVGFLLVRKSK